MRRVGGGFILSGTVASTLRRRESSGSTSSPIEASDLGASRGLGQTSTLPGRTSSMPQAQKQSPRTSPKHPPTIGHASSHISATAS
mmetsp:Transcript_13020/g.21919  ORF Transcript_13020/g.21919 Transcript_13020/m.21919 type:complete len:86 (+) Transcript_13020:559-816(+)